jgi:hypothetical protein
MKIDFSSLEYSFKNKPLLVGGKAMEYYGLRKAGADIDFIISLEDYENLAKMFPKNTEDLFGDLGVKVHGFELWTSITLFNYVFLKGRSIEEERFLVIALNDLLVLKSIAAYDRRNDPEVGPKYKKDEDLILEKIKKILYEKDPTPLL